MWCDIRWKDQSQKRKIHQFNSGATAWLVAQGEVLRDTKESGDTHKRKLRIMMKTGKN